MRFEATHQDGVAFALHRSSALEQGTVFLHGLGNSGRFWNGLLPHLEGRTTVVPDIPGFGDSAQSERGYDVVGVAEKLAELLAALGVGAPILVGHSMGAVVALELARIAPASAVVTICGTPFSALAVLSTPRAVFKTPRVAMNLGAQLVGGSLPVPAPVARLVASNGVLRWLALRPFVFSPTNLDPDVVAPAIRGAGGRGPVRAVIGARRYDLEQALRDLAVPIALIAGEHDRLIPDADHRRAVKIVTPEYAEVLTGTGHWPMIEAPEKLAHALARAFRAISAVR